MIKKICVITCFGLWLLCSNLQAQDPSGRFKFNAVLSGIGISLNTDTRYTPVYYMYDLVRQIGSKQKKVFLCYYIEPQFNLVSTERPVDLEFGTNLGLRLYQKLSDHFYIYEMIGSGPHFTTADVSRQAGGFIFSDNFAIGILKNIKNSLALNFQFRVRHLSNAGLKSPNAGIDTVNLLVGLVKMK